MIVRFFTLDTLKRNRRLGSDIHLRDTKSNLLSPNDRRGSHLSVQTTHLRNPSHCGSLSGMSFSSLKNPSQTSLEVAAEAAAAAAVASVVRNMQMGMMMPQMMDGQSMRLRSPSRATSLTGSSFTRFPSSAVNDGDNLSYVAFGSQHSYNPEVSELLFLPESMNSSAHQSITGYR